MPELLSSTPDKTEPTFSSDRIKIEQRKIEKEVARRRWAQDPGSWLEERLGQHGWSKQIEIMESVGKHRYTAVPSCFGSGKSWTAARIAAWWIDTHPPGEAFVVSTARSGKQVKAILWRELHRAHAAGNLRGRLNQTEWWLEVDGREEMVAFGRKPDDKDPTAFQGIHARYVLVILDEAAGISTELFEAASSLIVNTDSRMLAIGNPEEAGSEFADVCRPGSGWHVIRISAFITPNFTDEDVEGETCEKLISHAYVEEKRRKWGEQSPMWMAKVMGEFPETQTDGLFPISWIRAAQERILKAEGVKELGVDVGAGGDKSVQAFRHGPVVRIIKRDSNPDTMQTCGAVITSLKKTGATVAKIDKIGIGQGLVDRGIELKHPFVGINVASAAEDSERFVNLRAESYWGLREIFEAEEIDIDPNDEDLAAQLAAIKYKTTSAGKIQIEAKKEMIARLGHSPDDSDAVNNAFMKVPVVKKAKGATWGT
jgi:hypothetical protein